MDLQGIKLTWLGHATFKIETPGGHIVIIDPWVSGNPSTPADMKKFDSVDALLCTHGHFDHIGDAVALAKEHNPIVVGIFELPAQDDDPAVGVDADRSFGNRPVAE